jgi:ABC-type multidrug transport system fused ATPase/permease subunit
MIYIYDCSLRENIAFGIPPKKIDDKKVWKCLKEASLEAFVLEQCPNGLDTVVGENGIRLSGGQRQRLGIARALYQDASILVMDEATAALDNQTEKEVVKAIQHIEQSRTIITIAHRLTTIKNYDLIYVLEKGQIVSVDNYQNLALNCQVFKKMAEVANA